MAARQLTDDEMLNLLTLLDRVHVGVSRLIDHVKPSDEVLGIAEALGHDLGKACGMVRFAVGDRPKGSTN